MPLLERVIHVQWPLRVWFTRGLFDPANPLLAQVAAGSLPDGPARVFAVIDRALALAQPGLEQALAAYCAARPEALELASPPLLLEGGEAAKSTWAPVAAIHAALEKARIDRHSYVLAAGGGALLDVAGLAAATAHRGVRLLRVPSTTLSQADSGVGVKNGVNAFGKKNFIGTFAPPHAVLNDLDLPNSLPPKHRRAGYAEAVKVALIRDAAFFERMESEAPELAAFEPAALERVVRRCAELHLDHIAGSGDPFELGSARPLDFGHWSAHKLEALSGFRLGHGEAVAAGMALDVIYSRRQGWLPAAEAQRVLALLERLGFALSAPGLGLQGAGGRWRVLEGLEEFREHLGGALTVTQLRGIGQGFEVHDMDGRVLEAALAELRERASATAGEEPAP